MIKSEQDLILKNNKNTLIFGVLIFLTISLFIVNIITGPTNVSFSEVLLFFIGHEKGGVISIFRFPKACVALLIGISLSIAGLQMQTIFRNPLADPYILGVSSGAGLGVACFLMAATSVFSQLLSSTGIYMAAWLGSSLVLLLILLVSSKLKDVMTVLILGVMFGSAISAVISILQYFSSAPNLKAYVLWTMGSLTSVTYSNLIIMFIALCIGLFISAFTIKPLNAMLLGEYYAESMGVNIKKTRGLIFLSTGILTGTATAFCGPIGFIGIAVPHIARFIFQQSNHRILIPGSALIGASIMLFCDIVSQSIISDVVLPINSITALFGIPVIIYVIITQKR